MYNNQTNYLGDMYSNQNGYTKTPIQPINNSWNIGSVTPVSRIIVSKILKLMK